ncbi:GNAT family N-acetyltransferase [uncultured Methanomethylovorans sp.]|nr:GNAT family N-acetyltransferase [uncultured Methanomethylovorans sp.]
MTTLILVDEMDTIDYCLEEKLPSVEDFVADVIVLPEYQNKGIGTELMK